MMDKTYDIIMKTYIVLYDIYFDMSYYARQWNLIRYFSSATFLHLSHISTSKTTDF